MNSVELNNSAALSKQDLATLDVSKLTALSPEVISRQATINIGTIGHVAHGKSTVVKGVSGVQTVRFKNELERNITIKLDSRGPEMNETPPAANGKSKKRKADVNGDSGPQRKRPRKTKDDEQVYEVEYVLEHKKEKGKHFYLVKWKDWSSETNTWEPSIHLDGCHDELFTFLAKYCSKWEYNDNEFLKLRDKLSETNKNDLVKALKQYQSPKGIAIPPPHTKTTNERLKIVSRWPMVERDPYVVDILKNELLEAKLYKERQDQLDELKEWEDEMNSVIGNSASHISVVNNVDLERPPENFIYINEYLPGEKVIIPDDPLVGCTCDTCNGKKKRCCPMITGSVFAYDKDGRVKVPAGTPIYECNKRCKCGPDCGNRVVQKGRFVKLCIFRTSTGCGWGVKTQQTIPKGSFVTEYVGEVVISDEAEKRGKKYDKEGQTYLFDLDFNENEKNLCPFTVDAAMYGNVSHFVNHSCDPNMTVYAAWANCLDPNLPQLALFANREIKQGEEISFDYLNQSKMKKNNNSDVNGKGIVKKTGNKANMVCKCGSKRCRKFYL